MDIHVLDLVHGHDLFILYVAGIITAMVLVLITLSQGAFLFDNPPSEV